MSNTISKQDQAAVEYLRQQITIYFPEVAIHWAAMKNVDPARRNKPRVYETHRLGGVGGYVARTTEFGNTSLHASGLAADIYVKIQNPLLKAIGDALFSGFVANAAQLGLEEIIWNRQIWSKAHPAIRPYNGTKKHEDHVHVGFTAAAGKLRPPILVNVLQQAKAAVDAQFP